MYTHKNIIISSCSITFIAFIAFTILMLPFMVTLSMLMGCIILFGIYTLFHTINHNYDINYKYWLNFAAQFFALLFVSASFYIGLSFIAGSIVI